jgi:hypothetical protein
MEGQYEYRVLEADSLVNEHQLNELAGEGWRLVTIEQLNGKYVFYFERLRLEMQVAN